jgi:GT2 family glycosyltransferase
MTAEQPKVVVVILNWNGLSDTIDCLSSLQQIDYPNFAVTVIDNGSKRREAAAITKKFGTFVSVIEEEKNLGFTGGCNEGILWALRSGADYVLLLNNDTVVDPNFLTELVKVAEGDSQIGVVGPKILYHDQPNRIWCAGGKINFWTGITPLIGKNEVDNGKFDRIEEIDFASGAALLIKSEVIRKIGLLNDIYFAYYEETEWCTKAGKSGFRVVYVPKARVWHKIRKGRTTESEMYYMVRNRFIFVKRNSSSFQFFVFSLHFLATDLIVQITCKLFLRPKLFMAYIRGIRDGLRSLAICQNR